MRNDGPLAAFALCVVIILLLVTAYDYAYDAPRCPPHSEATYMWRSVGWVCTVEPLP